MLIFLKLGGAVITFGIVASFIVKEDLDMSSAIFGNSFCFENVYIQSVGTTAGIVEHQRTFGTLFLISIITVIIIIKKVMNR